MKTVLERFSTSALLALCAAALASGCGGQRAAEPGSTSKPARANPVPLLASIALPPVPGPPTGPGPAREPGGQALVGHGDGEDDGSRAQPIGPGLRALTRATTAKFLEIPPPPGAHPLVCDLTPFAGHLYASFAVQPINVDGARIYRLTPDGTWSLAFNWDRDGGPGRTHEVGGQGITRARAIGNRLMATDADAPLYGGFGLSDAPFEDYVFVTDESGVFPPLGDGFTPPAGTRIMPLSFHTFDVIAYRGNLVASGGTVSRLDKGTRYPGGIFVGSLDDGLLVPRWRPGEGWPVGVVRTTYMHRFGGRLYIGFQNNERACRWDLAVLTGDPLDPATPDPVLARVTEDGGWLTRRFASAAAAPSGPERGGTLYWLASGYARDSRGAALFASTDGQTFRRLSLPAGAGQPQDLAVVGTARFLLTTTGLYRAGPDHRFKRIADAPAGDPFGRWDTFCSAPLAVFDDALYAGSTRDGTLYRIASEATVH